MSEIYGNPSSQDHVFGWRAAEAVEDARRSVAGLIHSDPSEIVFTSGATESINLALKGWAQAQQRPTIVTAGAEHEAVLETCRQLRANLGVQVKYLAVDGGGHIDPAQLSDAVQAAETCLIALMLANHETGTVLPLHKYTPKTSRDGALLFTDLTQAVGRVPVDVRADGMDLAAFSAHKLYGPKGVGALFIRGGPGVGLEPLIVGGGQERGLRAGTLNVPAIVGFGEACRLAQLEMEQESERVGPLRDRLEQALLEELPDVWINGAGGNRLPNTSNLGFGGVDARTLIRDLHDIAVSTRSACSSGSPGPSPVLKAMGLSDDQAYSCVRFSLGRFTTGEDIEYTIEHVVSSVNKLRKLSPG
jgi:cysteine desulfurase